MRHRKCLSRLLVCYCKKA